MVASVVQSATTYNISSTASTVVLGAAPTAGNTLLAVMASDTTAAAAPTAGTGNGYTQRVGQVNAQGFYVWTRAVAGGESATTSFTLSTGSAAALAVVEIQGTYDKFGTGTTNTSTPAASRTTTGLAPATTDGLTVAIAGLHSLAAVPTGGAADNTFSFLAAKYSGLAQSTETGVVLAYKVTSSTAATGTTTLSWTGNVNDRDGVQIAFTGIGGGAASTAYRRVGKRRW
jgi:hypothetical protein